MKKQLLKIACLVVGILISTASFSQPNWYQPITSTNHTILLQSTIPMTIDGVQIESGDYIGVFYDSLGVLACGGFVEWAGTSSTIAAWGTDIGNDGFVNNEIFNFKIWDASTNLDLDATATFISTGFPNGNSFAVNGMSGLASLSATSPVVNPVAPEWDYSVTGTNHTILVPNTIPLTIDGLAIESGDFIGVFFDSLGTLKCGGYSEWNGQTNSVSAWGADIGLDGFAAGEEFVWKIWDASSNTELLASATYSVAFPNSGNFTVNGISGLESLVAATLPAPNWTYQITGSNHTILIQNTIPLTINGVQIESGDYLGVFYQANGALTCGGYAAWEGQTTNITAWGADVGNDGFAPSEEFIWKVFDASENMEFMAEAQYNLTGMFPNGGNFVVNGLSGLASLTAPFSIATDPGWTYSITATNHTILIPQTIITSIDGMAIDSGDYIGVFFDSLGILACAGYAEWTGQTAISAWGADIGNDGFVAGKQFKWKIWDASENIVYDVYATYIPISINNQIFNQGNFAVNGISGLSSLSTRESQEIVLPYGWSIFSTYINPINSSFDTTFNEIVSNVEIVKNYLGQTYWPFYGVNLIGNISICEGYQIKMNLEDTLIITGLSVHPENTNCDIPAEWSIISYLRKSPSSVVDMMSTIVSDIVIVKDYLGEIYWPLYGVNSIGNMDPGEGYQIKMLNATTLTYPANTANVSKSNIQILKPNYFKGVKNTGSNMTLGIPKTAWEIEPQIGDEIGIFCENGKLVGSSVFIGENLAISIWANDDLTEEIDGMIESEKFIIRIWGGENEQILEIENWLEGDEFYGTNKISVAEKLSTFQLSTFQLHQNTPNPFSENTEISFYIYENAFVEIELFDILGEKIETIQAQNYPAGNHSIVYDKKNLQSGVYFYRLSVKDFSATKSLSIF